jgi:hypothetical protein
MSETNGRTHHYFAEASVLSGHLELPLEQHIKPQAYTKLNPEGGYLAQQAENYRLESVISFRSAHTQVSGNRDVKPGHGWATLSTTSIEKLNVLDVLTADLVVGQIMTEHPLVGYVPHISFLGTRFENLRIAGHPVDLHLDMDVLGAKPDGDAPYTLDAGVQSRVSAQYKEVLGSADLPAEVGERYNRLASDLGKPETVDCSLVQKTAGGFPGHCFGHVIRVPNFGTITLARLHLKHEDFVTGTSIPKKTTLHLTMLDLKLGCAIAGNSKLGTLSNNGATEP